MRYFTPLSFGLSLWNPMCFTLSAHLISDQLYFECSAATCGPREPDPVPKAELINWIRPVDGLGLGHVVKTNELPRFKDQEISHKNLLIFKSGFFWQSLNLATGPYSTRYLSQELSHTPLWGGRVGEGCWNVHLHPRPFMASHLQPTLLIYHTCPAPVALWVRDPRRKTNDPHPHQNRN